MQFDVQEILSSAGDLWHYKVLTIAGVKLSFGNIFLGLTGLIFSSRISKIISAQINKHFILKFVQNNNAQRTYQTFAFYASLAAVVALSLTLAGIPLTIFTVVGGALAIGVGFGSQNIVNNFISGIILLVEQPIKVDDVVEVDGVTGKVLTIGTRSTKIRTVDNKIYIVPNSFFLEKGVMNWTFETTTLRTTLTFGVAYGTDARLVEKLCMDILLNETGVEKTPEPQVFFDDFAESNLNFQLIFFTDLDKVTSQAYIKSLVRFKVNDLFKQHGIQMAFPQRDLNFNTTKPLEVKVLS